MLYDEGPIMCVESSGGSVVSESVSLIVLPASEMHAFVQNASDCITASGLAQ